MEGERCRPGRLGKLEAAVGGWRAEGELGVGGQEGGVLGLEGRILGVGGQGQDRTAPGVQAEGQGPSGGGERY